MQESREQGSTESRLPNATRNFTITLLVPEEVAARWPEWFTTERLMGGIYRALGFTGTANPSRRKVAPPRVRIAVLALVLVGSLGVGVMMGYIEASGYHLRVLAAIEQSQRVLRQRSVAAETARPRPPSAPAVKPASDQSPQPASPVQTSVSSPAVSSATAPAPARVASTATFRVQAGAFRNRENAEILVRQLHRDGFNAYIKPSRSLYKVQIGTFRDRKDAERLAEEMKAKQYKVIVTQETSSGN